MMVEDAEQYLDHETRIKRLESLLNNFLYGDWVNAQDNTQEELLRLRRLALQNRAMIIGRRIIANTRLLCDAQRISEAHRDEIIDFLNRHGMWLFGAINETEHLDDVYHQWLQRLRQELVRLGSENLLMADDELPPAQAQPQAEP